jgi:hypothetical protein
MAILQQTVEIPTDHRLKGAVSPKLYGKVKINGDIIGPFHEEWGEQ